MIDRLYFDTNIFYDVKRGKITRKEWEEFLSKCSDKRIKCFFSPISFVEIAFHINDDERNRFDYYKDIFKIMYDACNNNVLDDPDTFLRRILAKGITVDNREVEWAELCRVIAESESYEKLITGQITRWKWYRARVVFHAEYLHKFREEYEQQYVSEMLSSVIDNVHPAYKELKLANKLANVQTSKLRKKLTEFLQGEEFIKALLIGMCLRAGVALLKDVGKCEFDKNSIKSLWAFFSAYQWILHKIFEAGYNFEKKKNDYNDIHLLMYLALDDICFVTSDTHLRNKVGECEQKSRILTLKEAMKFLDTLVRLQRKD